jgi:hypothetical protein
MLWRVASGGPSGERLQTDSCRCRVKKSHYEVTKSEDHQWSCAAKAYFRPNGGQTCHLSNLCERERASHSRHHLTFGRHESAPIYPQAAQP